MADVRTLVVPSGDVLAESLSQLESALVAGGAKGTQRDLGPGGPGLYPCMGLAGVYVTEAPAAEVKLNTDKYVIEEGWPGSRSFHGHSLEAAHHEKVPPHVYTAAEMDDVATATKVKALGQIFNFGGGHKLAEIAPSEYEMLVDNLGNDPMEAISIATDTGLLWLFTKPVHILETLAGILDPMTSGSIPNPGSVWYSTDTTTGEDGTWRPLHGHIQDFNAVAGLLLDSPFPATVKPLMTNVENVKALILLGPNGRPPGAAAEPPDEAIDPFAAFAGGGGSASESLCEWRIWIPKAKAADSGSTVTGAVAGTPGHWLPVGVTPPASQDDLWDLKQLEAAMAKQPVWGIHEYVLTGDGKKQHWFGPDNMWSLWNDPALWPFDVTVTPPGSAGAEASVIVAWKMPTGPAIDVIQQQVTIVTQAAPLHHELLDSGVTSPFTIAAGDVTPPVAIVAGQWVEVTVQYTTHIEGGTGLISAQPVRGIAK